MEKTARIPRPTWFPARFDREQSYVYTKPIRVNGIDMRSGDPVDKNLFTTRKLTNLLHDRRIKLTDVQPDAPVAPQAIPVEFGPPYAPPMASQTVHPAEPKFQDTVTYTAGSNKSPRFSLPQGRRR